MARWLFRRPSVLWALVASVAFGLALWHALVNSQAFAVTEIDVPADYEFKLPASLIGQNLWRVDLPALAESLRAQQPHLKRIRVIRRLPHTLVIDVVARKPVAQVRVAQWHPVDREGYVLAQGKPAPWEGLVVLKGIDRPDAPLRVGQANDSDRLREAIALVERLRRLSALGPSALTLVDVGDVKHVSFVIDGELEIRCGSHEELPDQLARLGEVLRMVRRRQLAVRYIDLRFDEPVLGPKT